MIVQVYGVSYPTSIAWLYVADLVVASPAVRWLMNSIDRQLVLYPIPLGAESWHNAGRLFCP